MFCVNCGKQLNDNANFCDGCGTAIGGATAVNPQQQQQVVHTQQEEIVFNNLKCRMILGGQGHMTVTNERIIWNKSAINYVYGGLLALATRDSTSIRFVDMLSIEEISGNAITGHKMKLRTTYAKDYTFGFANREAGKKAVAYVREKSGR